MSQEIQFILYNLPNEDGKIQVIIKDETIWCTQKAMAQLFGVGVPAISKHLSNIYNEGELAPSATISKMETVQEEGNRNIRRTVDFYSLRGQHSYNPFGIGVKGWLQECMRFRKIYWII